jgi:hypothetical protein
MAGKSIITQFWVIMLALTIISSCQDPILVGGDLLDDEKLNVGFVNDFSITTKTIAGEKVVTFTPGVDSRTYFLGQLNDPIFGKVSADLFLQFNLQSKKPTYQTETKLKFDSLVLVLQYDTLGTYGAKSANQSIKVYQLEETYDINDTLYSDTNIKYIPNEIGKLDIVVNPKDSARITDHLTGKKVVKAPQLRVRLNDSFGKALIENADAAKNDTLFREYFKGVYITSSSQEPFLYGLNFIGSSLATSGINKLIMYYTVNDTLEQTYEYLINTATVNKFTHDRAGSQLESFIMNPAISDSLAFVQGIGGVKTLIKFNDLNRLDTVLINKAELEIFVANIPGQSGVYSNPGQLILTRKNDTGTDVFIDDIGLLFSNRISQIETIFGGIPLTTANGTKYTMNITNHIKKSIKDKSFNSDIYLNLLTESENPRRAIFYGGKHSKFPVKLNITYTKK